jgi:hypothetical protein
MAATAVFQLSAKSSSPLLAQTVPMAAAVALSVLFQTQTSPLFSTFTFTLIAPVATVAMALVILETVTTASL